MKKIKKLKKMVKHAAKQGLDIDMEDQALYDLHSNDDRDAFDECYIPYSRQIVVRDFPGSKKNSELSQFVNAIIASCLLLVINVDLYLYDHQLGFFRRISNPEVFVERMLPENVVDRLGLKDIKEIISKILRKPSLQAELSTINSNPLLANCVNGIVDLSGDTIRLLPHSESYRFTYCINASYTPGDQFAESSAFNGFCQTSLDDCPEKRQLLLEILGYCCSDSIDGKCAFFLKGQPDSGKSVMGHVLTHLIGEDLVASVQLDSLSGRFNRAQLANKKLNYCGEIKATKLNDITVFKMITGGDRIEGELKGKDAFFFTPGCKLVFSGNALPGTSEADATRAFANRLVVLLFNQSIPKEKQDKSLLEKLLGEIDSIFTLAMYALHDLKQRNYKFTLPQESVEFIDAFSRTENSVSSFAEDCCVIGKDQKVFNVDLLSAYAQYCKRNGLEQYERGKFFSMLDDIPGVKPRRVRIGSENRHGRLGIGLIPDSGNPEQNLRID